MASAFTVKWDLIQNTLKSKVVIHNGPYSVEVAALWDTGATTSCISEEAVEKLHLLPTGIIPRLTPAGRDITQTYLVDVTLPNDVQIPDLRVCNSKIGEQGIGMLVGMDIISKGDFIVNNYQGKTAFSFRMPSESFMDFVTGIQWMNVIKRKSTPPKKYRKKKNKPYQIRCKGRQYSDIGCLLLLRPQPGFAGKNSFFVLHLMFKNSRMDGGENWRIL